ncbi:hypothetical protein BSKO_10009 [Bryopsis sp. KO-2023]|nr:hypothetical protein BSKO_10009 [Bryopsis sp. KO-2023]
MSREKWLQFEQSIARGQTHAGDDTGMTSAHPYASTSTVLPSPAPSPAEVSIVRESIPAPASLPTPPSVPETLPVQSATTSLPLASTCGLGTGSSSTHPNQGFEAAGRWGNQWQRAAVARAQGLFHAETVERLREEHVVSTLSPEDLLKLRQSFPNLPTYYDAYISYAIYERLDLAQTPVSAQQLANELGVDKTEINRRLYDKLGLQPHVTKLEWSEGRGKRNRVNWCLTSKLQGL